MEKQTDSSVELSSTNRPHTIKSPEYSGSESSSSKSSPNKNDGTR